MKVFQRLAANFKAEGVTALFGIMGDGNMYWMHELDALGGVNMLEVRHEGAGLGMADGWARATRTVGVGTATCGPGVSQLATAFLTASRAESPIVAFCGEHPTNDQEYNQRLDQARFAAGCEAGFVRLHTPDAADEAVLRLAKRTGALIATTLMAKTYLAEDEFHVGVSGTYANRTAMKLFEEADCVVALGASLNRYTIEHGYLYPNAKYVQIDTKPHVVMAGGRSAEVYVWADAKAGVEALDRVLEERGHKNVGYRTPDVKKQLTGQYEDRKEFPLDPNTVDPREIIRVLEQSVPMSFNLFTGSGATAGFGNIMFHRQRPVVLASHFFGCIGQMMPAAMGAVVATGNKPAMLVDGDASVMMHLAEFETMVRYHMPLMRHEEGGRRIRCEAGAHDRGRPHLAQRGHAALPADTLRTGRVTRA
jgi:thiamine pyrophosphate-dependent acetolactate synthase large subunit-like protein